MTKKKISDELLTRISEKLYVAVVCDTLDKLGVRENVLRYDIRPLYPEARIVGRAHTALSVDVYEIPEEPYKLEMEAVDTLKPGDCLVVTTNGSTKTSFWGELLSTASQARGAVGAIVDGFTRDTKAIMEMRFPVFVRGISPYDSKGRSEVMDIDCPIRCGDVLVHPGDIMFADYDGAVCIPQDLAEDVVRLAEEKVSGENTVREELAQGIPVKEVFAKYGIL